MEDHFQIVKTWRGYILVSSCLLPSSSAERARIYPDYFVDDSDTARDATPVSRNQVAQESKQDLLVPKSYHRGSITAVPLAGDFRNEISPLGTSNGSRLAVASEYFVEPDRMGQSMPTINDETVHSPESLQMAAPSWKRSSRDWEYSTRISSEEPTSCTSPTKFSTGTQAALVTTLGNKECCTNESLSEPVPTPPLASRPSPSRRLESRPKRRLSNDSIEEADAVES
ncbi:hypothetical protein J3459_012783 [Metarhizium acridum]|nr:hypothetical protein J3459_012783 [Metarhizium acridum]